MPMDLPSALFQVMMSRAQYHGDPPDGRRAERVETVVRLIAKVAKTDDEASVLAALGEHETYYAALVLYGHCDQMPKGQRCDNGKARGPWQLHREACPSAYQFAEGTMESLEAEARCAVKLLRWNAERGREHTKTPIHAAFCGYAGKSWDWPDADRRVKTAREIARQLRIARRSHNG